MPQLISVNIGDAALVQLGSRVVTSGIGKRPVARATVNELGLVGDVVADQKHHGGRDQAVYLYAATDLAWWEEHLGRPSHQAPSARN
jgi:MOSC domain-containing protein YiiM